ncbi:MAG: hypothetical protein JEZ11_04410 [Desulfobacterales bacterium]|nr:hypothetical protein [Desulfobacterales bacterium]
MLRAAWKKIRRFWQVADAVGRGRAVDVLEHETEELENIFALMVLGSFVGLPSPPIQITMDLMPHMERDLHLMLEKVSTAHDPLGDLFSVLSID